MTVKIKFIVFLIIWALICTSIFPVIFTTDTTIQIALFTTLIFASFISVLYSLVSIIQTLFSLIKRNYKAGFVHLLFSFIGIVTVPVAFSTGLLSLGFLGPNGKSTGSDNYAAYRDSTMTENGTLFLVDEISGFHDKVTFTAVFKDSVGISSTNNDFRTYSNLIETNRVFIISEEPFFDSATESYEYKVVTDKKFIDSNSIQIVYRNSTKDTLNFEMNKTKLTSSVDDDIKMNSSEELNE